MAMSCLDSDSPQKLAPVHITVGIDQCSNLENLWDITGKEIIFLYCLGMDERKMMNILIQFSVVKHWQKTCIIFRAETLLMFHQCFLQRN
jgi:hypothetical protein